MQTFSVQQQDFMCLLAILFLKPHQSTVTVVVKRLSRSSARTSIVTNICMMYLILSSDSIETKAISLFGDYHNIYNDGVLMRTLLNLVSKHFTLIGSVVNPLCHQWCQDTCLRTLCVVCIVIIQHVVRHLAEYMVAIV